MRISLVSIHLRNFRIHEDYTFTPARRGVTAIIGANGRGKSSIIDGIAWALYGTRPVTSMKNSSWRRMQAPPDAPSFVDLRLVVDGQDVRVKRSITNARNGSQQCECWMGNVGDDATTVAGPAVSHAQRWITRTIGLDENGFLSTILVQQKHVDALVSAGPAERRRILERLTGIEAVSAALAAAKDEERGYSKASELTGIDESALPRLRREIESLGVKRRKLEDREKSLADRLVSADEEGRSLRARVDEMDAAVVKITDLRTRRSVASGRLHDLEARISDLTSRREEMGRDLPRVRASTDDVRRMRTDISDAERRLAGLRSQVAALDAIIAAAPSPKDVEDLRSRLDAAEGVVASLDMDSLKSARDAAVTARADADARRRQARKSLGEISGDMAQCPTCLQPISDPQHVIDELNAVITAADADEARANDELNRAVSDMDAAASAVSNRDSLREELARAKKAADDAGDARERRVPLTAEVESDEASVASMRSALGRVEADSVKTTEYERITAELTGVMEERERLSGDLRDLDGSIAEVGTTATSDRLSRLRGELDSKRATRADLQSSLVGIRGDISLIEERIRSTTHDANDLEERMKKRGELLSRLEVSTGSVSILGAFRERMILSAIPRITDDASDLLTTMTDGAFTAVTIDRRFGINVECKDGTVESANQLSGGELSMVAICLRLAISVMLAGGSPSLLVLDEVLTAMDSDRAQAILEAMQGMSKGGQIIIVAHNEIIRSIADTVVQL